MELNESLPKHRCLDTVSSGCSSFVVFLHYDNGVLFLEICSFSKFLSYQKRRSSIKAISYSPVLSLFDYFEIRNKVLHHRSVKEVVEIIGDLWHDSFE